MKQAIKVLKIAALTYGTYGLITVCDPHLISDEAAEKNVVLSAAKAVTDLVLSGCKLCFIAPILAAQTITEEKGS